MAFTCSGGDGSSGFPFQIANLTDLQSWDDNWNQASPNIKSSYFILTADIDASATSTWNSGAGWIPIGTLANSIRGNLNGQGYTITGININRPTTDYVGFWGYVSHLATIQQVSLASVNITGQNKVGSLCGSENFIISKCFASGTVSGTSNVGGICGRISSTSTATNCYSLCSVSGTSYVGGFSGLSLSVLGVKPTSTNCYSYGAVSGSTDVGGFCGSNSGTITYCFYDTETSGQSDTGKGIPLSTANMKLPASFTSWDFSTIWDVLFPTTAYPTLEAFGNSHTLTSATPNTGSTSGGESITLTGTGFVEGVTDYAVSATIGGHAVTDFVVVSNTSITCTTPADTTGAKNIVLTFLDTGISTVVNGFTYGNTITSVTPSTGNIAGGTAVTLVGVGFTGATGATFGGTAATSFVVVSDTTITCVTPAHAVGAVTVAVGAITKANGFTYVSSPDPAISSLDPTWGTTAGGTRVVITGSGFTTATGVTFDGIPAYSYEIISDSKIIAFTPMNHKGVCDVVVIIP